jgi:UDP-N-acetylglucosamine 2-epimerase (non-hydrolysing)
MNPQRRAEIACVVGARPNFMKMAPVFDALRAYPHVHPRLIHTGQHYDAAMSRVFFDELGLPEPDVNLEVGSASHAIQTARILEKFDALLEESPPDVVVVAGDVNSTIACALAAVKRMIPVAHVESGLRSRDRSMPEEINRILTDQISDFLFTPSADAVDNLLAEGIDRAKIHFVGNSMIDSLKRHLPAARSRDTLRRFGLARRAFAVVTLHRPSNVDEPESLGAILEALRALASKIPVVFPVHPRTLVRLESLGGAAAPGLLLTEPLGYLDFLSLMDAARLVLTDSGGIQEETTALGFPCLTQRDNTERPITVHEGTNRLIGGDPSAIGPAAGEVLAEEACELHEAQEATTPARWDGHAGERIATILAASVTPNRAHTHTAGFEKKSQARV